MKIASEVFSSEACDSTVSCAFHIINVVPDFSDTLLRILYDKCFYLLNRDYYEPYSSPECAGFSPGPGRVVDILGASGASDPGSNPGRGVDPFYASTYS